MTGNTPHTLVCHSPAHAEQLHRILTESGYESPTQIDEVVAFYGPPLEAEVVAGLARSHGFAEDWQIERMWQTPKEDKE